MYICAKLRSRDPENQKQHSLTILRFDYIWSPLNKSITVHKELSKYKIRDKNVCAFRTTNLSMYTAKLRLHEIQCLSEGAKLNINN